MVPYRPDLKDKARSLRKDPTDSERCLWRRLRGKQVLGTQFYRQRPLGKYIVDFYAPAARLVVEVDGSQHGEAGHSIRDGLRDAFLAAAGLQVLRFSSREVLKETDAVMERICRVVETRVKDQRG